MLLKTRFLIRRPDEHTLYLSHCLEPIALLTKWSMASKDTCLIHSSLVLEVIPANKWLLSSLLFLGCECGRDDGQYLLLRLGSAPSNIFEAKYMFLRTVEPFIISAALSSLLWLLLRLMGLIFFRCCDDDGKTSLLDSETWREHNYIWATVWNPLPLQNHGISAYYTLRRF